MAETTQGEWGFGGPTARNGLHRRDEDNSKKRETCAWVAAATTTTAVVTAAATATATLATAAATDTQFEIPRRCCYIGNTTTSCYYPGRISKRHRASTSLGIAVRCHGYWNGVAIALRNKRKGGTGGVRAFFCHPFDYIYNLSSLRYPSKEYKKDKYWPHWVLLLAIHHANRYYLFISSDIFQKFSY